MSHLCSSERKTATHIKFTLHLCCLPSFLVFFIIWWAFIKGSDWETDSQTQNEDLQVSALNSLTILVKMTIIIYLDENSLILYCNSIFLLFGGQCNL